jgi:hypothetical protein
MEEDGTAGSHQKRQMEVYLDDDDVLAEALGLDAGDYICVRVNSSWPEKSLLEGDIIMLRPSGAPGEGDIVLIEEGGRKRLAIASRPGFLDTLYGRRPLEAAERVIAVGVALARRLGDRDERER